MIRSLLILAALAVWPTASAMAQGKPAKQLFGAQTLPADMPSAPIGFYSRGCQAGAVQLPPDGPTWQAMRLSRNRQWGQPALVDFLERLSRDARADGWPGLLVGDMAQPRGGPMASGHASHQIGLDADIWLTPMPATRLSERQREDMAAVPVTEEGPHEVYPNRWTAQHGRLIRRAAIDPRVERIFVAPGIKKAMCAMRWPDRAFLAKVRPYYGHNYHFHVRLKCPAGTPCRAQAPVPAGDGCGKELDYWYTAAPYKKPEDENKPVKPAKPVTLADLPPACRTVLAAPDEPGARTMLQALRGKSAAASPAGDPGAAAGSSGGDSIGALIESGGAAAD